MDAPQSVRDMLSVYHDAAGCAPDTFERMRHPFAEDDLAAWRRLHSTSSTSNTKSEFP
jgi:hypothetical protein